MARIRAAVDARAESGADIVIVARTDARQADSLQVRPCCKALISRYGVMLSVLQGGAPSAGCISRAHKANERCPRHPRSLAE